VPCETILLCGVPIEFENEFMITLTSLVVIEELVDSYSVSGNPKFVPMKM
jgi:hypothetical protein